MDSENNVTTHLTQTTLHFLLEKQILFKPGTKDM